MINKPLIMLIDGNSLMHRAFHALPPLTTRKTGEDTGALYGFTRMMLKALASYKPDYCAIAFDRKERTFRHLKFEDYKAQRPETPSALVAQLERVKQLVAAFNISVFDAAGYEADDILGTLAVQACEQGLNSIVVTGDNDAFQLISSCVKVLTPGKTLNDIAFYDESAVLKKYGVTPKQIPDFKGLKGDPSDNIPGVPGVGEKTATRLLQQFGSIESIYQDIDRVPQEKLRHILMENKALAFRSKELATIVTTVPLNLDLHACKTNAYDRQKVRDIFRELEFYKLLDVLPASGNTGHSGENQSPEEDDKAANVKRNISRIVKTDAEAEAVIQKMLATSHVALWLDLVLESRGKLMLSGIALAAVPDESYYIPLEGAAVSQERVMKLMKTLLENPQIGKIMHDAKVNMLYFLDNNIKLNNLTFDTMIAGHLLGEKALDIKTMALSHLNVDLSVNNAANKSLELIPLHPEANSNNNEKKAIMAEVINRLRKELEPSLHQEQLWELFQKTELPLTVILAYMERNGVKLDTGIIREISLELEAQLGHTETMIYDQVGHRFNINSPQQLGIILFEELKLPPARKTRTGYSTDAAVLEELKDVHPVIEYILEYRRLVKLKSTYIDVLPNLIDSSTGRLHTNFNQTATATGRLSSSNPNLQNIPLRGEWGKKLRRAFVAESPCMLLAGDYSQIDLRILAHLSQDESLLQAFRDNRDIHSATASEIFNVPIDKITPDMRRVAKVVNFGVIYGMSDYGLEQATELSRQEAAQFITAYFRKYPGVQSYLEKTKKQARETGYVNTLLGRRRYIPEIRSSNRQVIEAAERMAINMPVQGTAADLVKRAMVDIQKRMDENSLRSKMILQIHDELIFEVLPDEMEKMKILVKNTMSGAMQLSVPLKVAIKIGKNWGDMEEVVDSSSPSDIKSNA